MNKLFKVAVMAVAIVGLVATSQQSATAGDQRMNFETNFTATVIGSNDVTSSAIVLDLASGPRWAEYVTVQTPTAGTVSWKFGPTLTTGEVANLVAIPSNTVYTIPCGGGYNLALSMRFNSPTNAGSAATIKGKVIGFQ